MSVQVLGTERERGNHEIWELYVRKVVTEYLGNTDSSDLTLLSDMLNSGFQDVEYFCTQLYAHGAVLPEITYLSNTYTHIHLHILVCMCTCVYVCVHPGWYIMQLCANGCVLYCHSASWVHACELVWIMFVSIQCIRTYMCSQGHPVISVSQSLAVLQLMNASLIFSYPRTSAFLNDNLTPWAFVFFCSENQECSGPITFHALLETKAWFEVHIVQSNIWWKFYAYCSLTIRFMMFEWYWKHEWYFRFILCVYVR